MGPPGAAKDGRRGIELREALCMLITGASRTTGDMACAAGILLADAGECRGGGRTWRRRRGATRCWRRK